MKNIILTACIALSVTANAQTQQGRSSVTGDSKMKEGKVIYESTSQVTFIAANPNSEFARNFPKSRTENFELLFGKNQAIWQSLPDINAETDNAFGTSSGGTRMVMSTASGAAGATFFDFEKGRKVSERELNSKNYLIEDTLVKLKWKLSEESREILGYKTFKATAQSIGTRPNVRMENGQIVRETVADTSVITAWFTPEIPVAAGPQYQGQLPGLILALDINNGRTVYRALEITPKVNLASIKEPKSGKRISMDEFKKEQDKQMDEFRKRLSENGGQIRIGGTAN